VIDKKQVAANEIWDKRILSSPRWAREQMKVAAVGRTDALKGLNVDGSRLTTSGLIP
jgi:hypothetical protein